MGTRGRPPRVDHTDDATRALEEWLAATHPEPESESDRRTVRKVLGDSTYAVEQERRHDG